MLTINVLILYNWIEDSMRKLIILLISTIVITNVFCQPKIKGEMIVETQESLEDYYETDNKFYGFSSDINIEKDLLLNQKKITSLSITFLKQNKSFNFSKHDYNDNFDRSYFLYFEKNDNIINELSNIKNCLLYIEKIFNENRFNDIERIEYRYKPFDNYPNIIIHPINKYIWFSYGELHINDIKHLIKFITSLENKIAELLK